MTRTYTGWEYIIHSVPGYPAPDYIEPTPPAVPVIPAVWNDSIPAVCIDAANVNISTFNATPLGGTYTGPGIVGTSFNPSTAGVGTITLTYTLASGESDTNTIVVNPLPTLTINIASLGSPLPFVAGSTTYRWRPPIDLVGTATPLGGTYTGPGVASNIFNPTAAGLGTHTITYSFTDGNSCAATATDIIQVITHPPTLPPPPSGPTQPGLPPFVDPISPGLPDFTPYYEPTLREQEFGVTFFTSDPPAPPGGGGGGFPGDPGGGGFIPGGGDPGGGDPGGGLSPESHYALDGLNAFQFDFVFSKTTEGLFTFTISNTPRAFGVSYAQHITDAVAVYDYNGTNLWIKRD